MPLRRRLGLPDVRPGPRKVGLRQARGCAGRQRALASDGGRHKAEPILVRLVWILVRDIYLRQAVPIAVCTSSEIVQCFIESYEAVLPQMKRSTCAGPVEFRAGHGMLW